MKAKLALSVFSAMLASACAGPMTWDEKVFPQQPTYSGATPGAAIAQSPAPYETIESRGGD